MGLRHSTWMRRAVRSVGVGVIAVVTALAVPGIAAADPGMGFDPNAPGVYGIGDMIAYQNSAGSLATAGFTNFRDWGLGMKAGTSPSIAELDGGGYEIAFQANTGTLWTVGTAGTRSWGLGMMAGTSPSIAGVVGGGYVVAFQANTGALFTTGVSGTRNWGLGMRAGTSPSVIGLPVGGFQIAFQANTGTLWAAGTQGVRNYGLGMAAGSSPSARVEGSSSIAVAFQANTGELWMLGAGGAFDSHESMAAGTSPSNVNVRRGYAIAYQSSSHSVNVLADEDSHPGLGMATGTSPAVAAAGFTQVTTFQANTGELWVTTEAGSGSLGLHMRPGTSPAISSVLPFSKHPAPNFVTHFSFHGSSLVVAAIGTGQERTHTGFTSDGRWIDMVATLHTYLSTDHYTLGVVVTAVSFVAYNNDGSTTPISNPIGNGAKRVGDAFWVNQVEPGLFRAVLVNLGAPGNSGFLATPYLCVSSTTAPWTAYCGA